MEGFQLLQPADRATIRQKVSARDSKVRELACITIAFNTRRLFHFLLHNGGLASTFLFSIPQHTVGPSPCNHREIYQSPACIYKADSVKHYVSAIADGCCCNVIVEMLVCMMLKVKIAKRKRPSAGQGTLSAWAGVSPPSAPARARMASTSAAATAAAPAGSDGLEGLIASAGARV